MSIEILDKQLGVLFAWLIRGYIGRVPSGLAAMAEKFSVDADVVSGWAAGTMIPPIDVDDLDAAPGVLTQRDILEWLEGEVARLEAADTANLIWKAEPQKSGLDS